MVGPLGGNVKGFLREGDDRDVFVVSFELEKDSPMKIKPLYEALHGELATDGWVDPIDGSDKFEGLYWERILENGMKEQHIWWRAVKYPGGTEAFSRWACKIDFQTLAVRDTEIAYKGKKKKIEHADFIIRLWFWVQWDPGDKFKKSVVKNLQQTFRRQLYKDELEQDTDKLKDYAEKTRKFLKTYLDMEVSGEAPKLFHPEGGYKDQFSP